MIAAAFATLSRRSSAQHSSPPGPPPLPPSYNEGVALARARRRRLADGRRVVAAAAPSGGGVVTSAAAAALASAGLEGQREEEPAGDPEERGLGAAEGAGASAALGTSVVDAAADVDRHVECRKRLVDRHLQPLQATPSADAAPPPIETPHERVLHRRALEHEAEHPPRRGTPRARRGRRLPAANACRCTRRAR